MNNAGKGMSGLQSVEEFHHFLLRNDSFFCDYVNSPLMLSVFDTHLMRESMISIMAQVLGNGWSPTSSMWNAAASFFTMALKTVSFVRSSLVVWESLSLSNEKATTFFLRCSTRGCLKISAKPRIPRLLLNLESTRKSIPICTRWFATWCSTLSN